MRSGKRITAFLKSLIVSLAAISGVIPGTFSAAEAYAGTIENVTDKTITCLGTGVIGNPTEGNGGWNYVYFGSFGEDGSKNPVRYRVLSKQLGGDSGFTTKASAAEGAEQVPAMLLDCDSVLEYKKFDEDGSPNEEGHDAKEWAYSDIRRWLNGDFKNSTFTAAEISAIASSSKGEKGSGDGNISNYYGWASLTGEQIFLLDAVEVINSLYGYETDPSLYNLSGNRVKKKNGSEDQVVWWWLRSPSGDGTKPNCAIGVSTVGTLDTNTSVNNENVGVSPAFNVNLKSFIFTSLISGTAGEPGAEYKLTAADANMSVAVPEGSNISMAWDREKSAWRVRVPYKITGSNAGKADRISVLMLDKSYEAANTNNAQIKYYGALAGNYDEGGTMKTEGEGSFILPAGYDPSWKTYIVAEEVHTDDPGTENIDESLYTDYAAVSRYPVSIPFVSDTPLASIGEAFFRTVQEAIDTADPEDTVKLLKDTKISSPLINNKKVTLDLNGRTIDRGLKGQDTKTNGSVIRIEGNGDLTLIDGSEANTGLITGGNSYLGGGVLVSGENAVFTMIGGTISGNKAGYGKGGGVFVSKGTFNMNGGEIKGNTAEDDGGGVYVDEGTFNLNSGEISGNTTKRSGGGVDARNGTFNMKGGEIAGNTAGCDGGGVEVYGDSYLESSGTFNMSGGKIGGNTAEGYGGGVSVWAYCTFNMSNGEISRNTAEDAGGGVYVSDNEGALFTVTGGKISDNTVKKNGTEKTQNVYLSEGKTITISGVLAETTSIGITTAASPTSESPVRVTGGWGTYMPEKAPDSYFRSDDPGFAFALNGDGEAAIGNPFPVTVTDGKGSGSYFRGTAVTIRADKAPEGQIFDRWTTGDGVEFDDSSSVTTAFTMPDKEVSVKANYRDMKAVAAPILTPAGGTYYSGQDVTVSCSTEGAYVYYTLDGSDPSKTDTEYSGTIHVTETVTIRAVAVKYGMKDSEVVTAAYTICSRTDPAYTPPTANKLTFTGEAQELIDPGNYKGGTMYYALGDKSGATEAYSGKVPKARNAGNYTVYYKIPETDTENGVGPTPVSVSIARKAVTVKAEDKTKEKGDADPSFTAVIDGLVEGEDESLINFTFSREEGEEAGTYAITPVGDKDQGNYTVTFETGTLTIEEGQGNKKEEGKQEEENYEPGKTDEPEKADEPVKTDEPGKKPDKVPLTESGAAYASPEDNFAAEAPGASGGTGGDIKNLVLDFSKVGESAVDPAGLKMTAISGSKFTTKAKLKDKDSFSVTGGVKVKVNKKTLIPSITCKKSGSVTVTLEDGNSYTVTFNVQKPKAQKSEKKMGTGEETVTKTVQVLFGTDINSGSLTASSKKGAAKVSVSGNSLLITPSGKDSIKVQWDYLNKKYKMSIKIK